MKHTRMMLNTNEFCGSMDATFLALFMPRWIALADSLERRMKLREDECLLWGLEFCSNESTGAYYLFAALSLCQAMERPSFFRNEDNEYPVEWIVRKKTNICIDDKGYGKDRNFTPRMVDVSEKMIAELKG